MDDDIEGLIQSLVTAKGEDDFLSVLAKAVEALGFEYYAYGLCFSLNTTRSEYLLRNNYPIGWQKLYENQGYIENDPTVKHGMTTNSPFIWEELLFENEPEFWEEANSFGLKSGWAQSSLLSRNATGMLTVARSNDKFLAKEMSHKAAHMALLNQSVQTGSQRFYLPDLIPELNVPLTFRELETVKWSAEGKTSAEIGMILNITERTVNFHMANTIKKLNVTNKTAAVVRAFQLGYI